MRELVHHLETRRQNTCGNDAGDRGARRFDAIEGCQ
jgi:hypothetical protein